MTKNKQQISGKKAHFENKFYKVGRIRYNSWATKVLNACDIVIYERELVHIYNSHKEELEKLGLSAREFIEVIVSKFNEVYEARENRKLLVVKGDDKSHYAVVELTFDDEKYKIKTALSVETKRLSKWKLLCANLAH